jgi:hypothetical protein
MLKVMKDVTKKNISNFNECLRHCGWGMDTSLLTIDHLVNHYKCNHSIGKEIWLKTLPILSKSSDNDDEYYHLCSSSYCPTEEETMQFLSNNDKTVEEKGGILVEVQEDSKETFESFLIRCVIATIVYNEMKWVKIMTPARHNTKLSFATSSLDGNVSQHLFKLKSLDWGLNLFLNVAKTVQTLQEKFKFVHGSLTVKHVYILNSNQVQFVKYDTGKSYIEIDSLVILGKSHNSNTKRLDISTFFASISEAITVKSLPIHRHLNTILLKINDKIENADPSYVIELCESMLNVINDNQKLDKYSNEVFKTISTQISLPVLLRKHSP